MRPFLVTLLLAAAVAIGAALVHSWAIFFTLLK
jgi:hypothetical protein